MILIGKRIQKQHIPFNQRVTVLINLRGLRGKLARREKILKTSSFCSLGLSLQLCKRRALQYVLLEEKLCLDLHRPVIIISLCLKISVCVRVCLCVCVCVYTPQTFALVCQPIQKGCKMGHFI